MNVKEDYQKLIDKISPGRIVVWKDGTHIYVPDGITWEY
jgi:hypothetical protein